MLLIRGYGSSFSMSPGLLSHMVTPAFAAGRKVLHDCTARPPPGAA